MLQATDACHAVPLRCEMLATLRGCAMFGRTMADLAALLGGLAGLRGTDIRKTDIGEGAAVLTADARVLRISRRASTVRIDITPHDDTDAEIERAQALLALLVRDLIPVLDPVDVHWLDHGARIAPEDFLSITGTVTPRRIEATSVSGTRPADITAPTAPCRDTGGAEYMLRHHFRATPTRAELVAEFGALAENRYERENPARRLASWAITGILALTALPVAAALAYLNVRKGENLRLNTQALVLTTGITVLGGSGMIGNWPTF